MQIDMIQLLEEAYKEYQLPKNFQKFTQEDAKIFLNSMMQQLLEFFHALYLLDCLKP